MSVTFAAGWALRRCHPQGGGYYDERDMDEAAPAAAGGYSNAAAAVMAAQTTLHPEADPSAVRIECENTTAVVIAVDVTGSMGDWTKIIWVCHHCLSCLLTVLLAHRILQRRTRLLRTTWFTLDLRFTQASSGAEACRTNCAEGDCRVHEIVLEHQLAKEHWEFIQPDRHRVRL